MVHDSCAVPPDQITQTSIQAPVAERSFRVVGEPDREIVLEIGRPFPDPDPTGDWMCPYILHGTDGARVQFVHGIDAVHALLVAMQGARIDLENAGLVVDHFGGEGPGDTGLPKLSIYSFGHEFAKRMEAHVEAEIQAMVDEKKRRR
jgi:hypothetical protein